MNEDLKKRWVAALRSGKYEQGHNSLRRSDGTFCCLGVLADIADPSAWVWTSVWQWHGDDQTIPDPEGIDIGLTRTNQEVLATMNDCGDSFSKIAEHIERTL